MGVVYEAVQMTVERRVAVKLLPFAALADANRLERFRNEIRAAGALHHPNIVPVFSVGVERGVHYFAMQYIDGPSLEKVIVELQVEARKAVEEVGAAKIVPHEQVPSWQLATEVISSTNSIEGSAIAIAGDDTVRAIQAAITTKQSTAPQEYFRTVAEWGCQVADALAYAHESGILHRDIKPGNLLLDERGKVWIADFGLARIEQDASLTLTGDILGTMRYMAPEQALAKRVLIDQRADIYSLGATLYELLTLKLVFDGKDREELLQQLAFDEPEPIRKHNAAIPTDLETIVLRTLEKNPSDRFESASDLADELRRFLDDRPLSIKPVGPLGRVTRYCRRRPALVGAFTATLLVAVISLVSALAISMNSRAKLIEAVASERAQRQLAADSLQFAKDTVDDWYVRFADDWLKKQDGVGLTEQQIHLFEKAARFYQSFASQLNDAESQRDRAVTLRRLAQLQQSANEDLTAKDTILKAIQIMEQAVERSPHQLENHLELAECRGFSAGTQGTRDMKVLRQRLTELENVPSELKTDPGWKRDFAWAHHSIGYAAWSYGDYATSDKHIQLAIDHNADLLAADPEDKTIQQQRQAFLSTLIRSRMEWIRPSVTNGQLREGISFEETQEYFNEVRRFAEARLQKDPDSWEKKGNFVDTVMNTASYFLPADEAEEILLRCADIAKARLASRPDVPQYAKNVYVVSQKLENHYSRNAQHEKALAAARSLYKYRRIGFHLMKLGRFEDAIQAHQSKLDTDQAALATDLDDTRKKQYQFDIGRTHMDIGRVEFSLAEGLLSEGKSQLALDHAGKAYAHFLDSHRGFHAVKDPSHLPLAIGLDDLRGELLLEVKQRCESFAQKLLKHELPGEAGVYLSRSQWAHLKAIEDFRRAVELDPKDPSVYWLVKLLREQGNLAEAEEVLTRFANQDLATNNNVITVIVPPDSDWKWLHTTDGIDPAEAQKGFHTTFIKMNFDDASWSDGKDSPQPHGGFAYGEEFFEGIDIGQPANENHRCTAYFRHRFRTTKTASNLELRCRRDDGMIVYLDGKEVLRDNVDEGPEAYHLHATETIDNAEEFRVRRYPINQTLAAGEHVIAVSLHNRAGGSSDLRIARITLVELEPESKPEPPVGREN